MATDGGEDSRYHKDVETLDADHPWHIIHELIPDGAVVLDIGCGSGGLGRFLAGRASAVDGIEANDERAAVASEHLRTVVNAFAGPAVDDSLPGRYDVIIFADVLEHIGYPDDTLHWAAAKLVPGGTILALIPNSANWKFRRKILKGDWSYADTGYFDRDHVRFFDIRTARELGERVGFAEAGLRYVPGQLPKPLNTWLRGATAATTMRPNLFAGHVLVSWRPATT